jgi:hypothetical protein
MVSKQQPSVERLTSSLPREERKLKLLMVNRLGVGAVDKNSSIGGICDNFLQLATGGSCGIQPESSSFCLFRR